MLCRKIIAVCSVIHPKHINTLCGQNVEVLNVKPGGIYSNHWASKDHCSAEAKTKRDICQHNTTITENKISIRRGFPKF